MQEEQFITLNNLYYNPYSGKYLRDISELYERIKNGNLPSINNKIAISIGNIPRRDDGSLDAVIACVRSIIKHTVQNDYNLVYSQVKEREYSCEFLDLSFKIGGLNALFFSAYLMLNDPFEDAIDFRLSSEKLYEIYDQKSYNNLSTNNRWQNGLKGFGCYETRIIIRDESSEIQDDILEEENYYLIGDWVDRVLEQLPSEGYDDLKDTLNRIKNNIGDRHISKPHGNILEKSIINSIRREGNLTDTGKQFMKYAYEKGLNRLLNKLADSINNTDELWKELADIKTEGTLIDLLDPDEYEIQKRKGKVGSNVFYEGTQQVDSKKELVNNLSKIIGQRPAREVITKYNNVITKELVDKLKIFSQNYADALLTALGNLPLGWFDLRGKSYQDAVRFGLNILESEKPDVSAFMIRKEEERKLAKIADELSKTRLKSEQTEGVEEISFETKPKSRVFDETQVKPDPGRTVVTRGKKNYGKK